MDEQQDDIPAVRQPDQKLTWQDGIAMISLLGLVVLSLLPATWVLNTFFGSGWPRNWPLALLVVSATWVLLTLLGKYVWLFFMARFVGKASVGPLVAYGIPPRISRFDRRFIHRHFQPGGAPERTGSSALKTTAWLARMLASAYLFGAMLGIALSFLPFMRGDRRLIGLAAFFGVVGLLHLWIEGYGCRRGPD